jgi:hypothetical protein
MVKTDYNNILKIVVILLVVGIAYLIYVLYNKSSSDSSSSDVLSNVHVSSSRVHGGSPSSSVSYSKKSSPSVEQHNSHVGHHENMEHHGNEVHSSSVSVRHGIEGNPSGLSNPIMQKINSLRGNNIVGGDNIEHFSQNHEYEVERNETAFPKDQLTAQELLPQDNNSLWAQVNPEGEGSLKDRNFLQSGYHIGINTVGQTLRNANLQLRSEPPCPQVVVSPFLQSTITPDTSRRVFEVGNCG